VKVFNINGKESNWIPKAGSNRKRSSFHTLAKNLLSKRFPTAQILDEVPFKPLSGKTLYLDLYITPHNIAIEVQGQQHYKFNSHFHKTIFDFHQQQSNDQIKKIWCNKNGIELITLSCYETPEDWIGKFNEC
tara:strand:- start:83 stop:478 length:396 start_codon:yes stop_codon:yes gene_type:complete